MPIKTKLSLLEPSGGINVLRVAPAAALHKYAGLANLAGRSLAVFLALTSVVLGFFFV